MMVIEENVVFKQKVDFNIKKRWYFIEKREVI